MEQKWKIIDSPIRQRLLSKFISLDKSFLHLCVTAAFTELDIFSLIWLHLQPPSSPSSHLLKAKLSARIAFKLFPMHHHSIKIEIFGTNFHQPELPVLSRRKHRSALNEFQRVLTL